MIDLDLDTRLEIMIAYFAAIEARLQEIEKKIDQVQTWNS
jgi:tetrahydromethanopterin S-methyltransferase subunit G